MSTSSSRQAAVFSLHWPCDGSLTHSSAESGSVSSLKLLLFIHVLSFFRRFSAISKFVAAHMRCINIMIGGWQTQLLQTCNAGHCVLTHCFPNECCWRVYCIRRWSHRDGPDFVGSVPESHWTRLTDRRHRMVPQRVCRPQQQLLVKKNVDFKRVAIHTVFEIKTNGVTNLNYSWRG